MSEKTFYNTKQKKLILNFLAENANRQFSAKEISDILNQNASIGESTVYRLIKKLTDEGEIRRFHGKNNKSVVYQFAGQNPHCHEHFHLKCTCCGGLIHLDCGLAKSFSEHMDTCHGFLVDPVKTIIYGTCAKCFIHKAKEETSI